jgi:hypothetical protein
MILAIAVRNAADLARRISTWRKAKSGATQAGAGKGSIKTVWHIFGW